MELAIGMKILIGLIVFVVLCIIISVSVYFSVFSKKQISATPTQIAVTSQTVVDYFTVPANATQFNTCLSRETGCFTPLFTCGGGGICNILSANLNKNFALADSTIGMKQWMFPKLDLNPMNYVGINIIPAITTIGQNSRIGVLITDFKVEITDTNGNIQSPDINYTISAAHGYQVEPAVTIVSKSNYPIFINKINIRSEWHNWQSGEHGPVII